HVEKKRTPAQLSGANLLPRKIANIGVDVLESAYRPHHGDPRAQQPALSPGLSIGNLSNGQTGTLGALVQAPDGKQYLLSNWHVLAGSSEAKAGDQIVQPGPMHLGSNLAHQVATLDRSLSPYEQLDAALGLINGGVPIDRSIFDLGL